MLENKFTGPSGESVVPPGFTPSQAYNARRREDAFAGMLPGETRTIANPEPNVYFETRTRMKPEVLRRLLEVQATMLPTREKSS